MIVEFSPNEPQEFTLKRDSRPYTLPNQAGSLYTLSDGRILHLSPVCAQAIADLRLGPNESFRVCLHQKGNGLPYWSAWLSPETEKARAAAEAPELERQLAESISIVRGRRRSPETAVLERADLPATGTEGAALPAISRKPAIAAVAGDRRGKPGPIPYNVAFREIVKLVASELLQAGEQWSDQARQDAVSTLFIAAGKAGWLGLWEREDAA